MLSGLDDSKRITKSLHYYANDGKHQMHACVNESIIRERTGKSAAEYAEWCSKRVREASPKLLMQGLGEVIDDTRTKNFVKTKLIEETAQALELFASFPQLE